MKNQPQQPTTKDWNLTVTPRSELKQLQKMAVPVRVTGGVNFYLKFPDLD